MAPMGPFCKPRVFTRGYDCIFPVSYTHLDVYKRQAQDWAEMLYRMYNKWAQAHGMTVELSLIHI